MKPATSIDLWGADNFIWEGSYQGGKIIVNLLRKTFEEMAIIINPETLNISGQIYKELKSLLKKNRLK